jgi:UDP-N-acetyl-2-amino-2-deoxyglucuronate dehydrogenase
VRVGIIGTGAIANTHARAYKNIGYDVKVCTDINEEAGRNFADLHGAEFVKTYQEVCRHRQVDYVDVCTFPDFRLQPLEICAETRKHIHVEKPISTNLETARKMIEIACKAEIQLGVVSQHRFADSSRFLARAITAGRMGRILQADAYVKWYRPAQYYSRPVKGTWVTEGGGALINQAIHQVDILLWLAGPVEQLFACWQLGALHKIESEDVLSAVVRYASGATGVIQASTALWPGYSDRIEIHGTKGTAILIGDNLTVWDVQDDSGEPARLQKEGLSGSSDPLAISLTPFERQFLDFGEAICDRRKPLVSGEDGYRALEVVLAAYRSCREGRGVCLATPVEVP